MSDKTLLALDQGTTSSRAILFSDSGKILDVRQRELTLHYPHIGWVEQDAEDIWNDTLWAMQEVVGRQGDAASNIAGIGITNQRETTIVWDRETGKPLYNAIVWQDRRTAELCTSLKEKGLEPVIVEKTGLLLDPYFSATKIAWILDNVEGARARAEAGELAFGTVDCFLLWRLTGGAVHATDITNASRTMLYNIQDECWDDNLLEIFDIPQSMLPEVKENAAVYGAVLDEFLPVSLSVLGMAGDQQAALIGQGCFDHGMVKSTYGTGCFALMNIGADFKASQNRLLTTVGYKINGQMRYAVEGSIFIAGAAIQWLRDGLDAIEHAAESEEIALSVPDNNGVYFVPAFTGLGAPHWKPEARAMIYGLGRESTKAHLVRAALEAQAYQTHDLMEAMEGDSGVQPSCLRVDGGLVNNGFMAQFLADMLDVSIEVPKVTETTAWGAACLAGLSSGVFGDLNDVSGRWVEDKTYTPSMEADMRTSLLEGWSRALNCLL